MLRLMNPPTHADPLTFSPVTCADFEKLAALRVAAMRESLERVGRFDPERSRARLQRSFYPEHSAFIVADEQRIGFYTFRPAPNGLHLDHFYLLPEWQGRGLGSRVLRKLLTHADAWQVPIYLGALRESPANHFYQRHGFVPAEETEWDIHYVRPPQPVT